MDFEQLYNVYYMQVYSYVMTLIKNGHLAEEITQDVFFKALKSFHSYEGRSGELTWLCAIAKNACMDHLRKKSGKVNIPLEEPYKEVFQLRIFGELSFERIGRLFGKTENWARVTYHRAKLKMQERMDERE